MEKMGWNGGRLQISVTLQEKHPKAVSDIVRATIPTTGQKTRLCPPLFRRAGLLPSRAPWAGILKRAAWAGLHQV